VSYGRGKYVYQQKLYIKVGLHRPQGLLGSCMMEGKYIFQSSATNIAASIVPFIAVDAK